ncbi:VgrG-related protein [Kitasatospora sp. NPDC052896]|uniref:VgrG-related protein n=1 Tax=Kitasatospora sp. NPDC052896 TaxID=3364061 RepID=UPI0037CC5D5C
MSVGPDGVGFVIGVPGPLPPAWADVPKELRIEEGPGLPASAVVRFLDPSRTLVGETGLAIGGKFTVMVATSDSSGTRPLFTGEVVGLEAEFDAMGSYTTVRALDVSHRLQRGRHIAGYPQMTASEIACVVLEAAGVTELSIDDTETEYEYATQPNVSDWDFLRTLAVENGREMFVRDGVFHFTKPVPASSAPATSTDPQQSPYVLDLGKNVHAMRLLANSVNQVATVEVRGWDVATKTAVQAPVTVAPSPESQFGLTPARATAPFAPARTIVADVPYGTAAQANAVATALAADAAAALGELEITSVGNPLLRIGLPVAVSGGGVPFDGKYTVTGSLHTYQRGYGYETRITVSGRQNRTLAGLASGAGAPARSPRVPSVATGVVVDILRPGQNPPSGYPAQAEQAWVKLKFPWLSDSAEGGDPAYVSDWVRTMQLGGTKGGGLFCPEIDDEVLVAFEQGLLDRPVVLGGLYNGVDSPTKLPVALVDGSKVAVRTLSSRVGDRMELLGAASGGGRGAGVRVTQGVRISTGDDRLTVALDRQQTVITVHSDGKITITGKEEVTVTGNGITLDAGAGALKLTGGSVSIDGDADVVVKAPLIKLN